MIRKSAHFPDFARTVLIACVCLTATAQGQNTFPVQEPETSPLFPEAYAIIGQEGYLFPVDMGDWPVQIDTTHQLFVDDYLIKSSSEVTREFHELKPHPANPIYTPSQRLGMLFYVMKGEEGLWRIWYQQRVRYKDKDGNQRRHPTGYIESDDGIHWREPNLGVVIADGSTENNYVFEKSLEGIWYEPWETDPNRRFKGLAHYEPDNDENQSQVCEGYWLYTSPDGIHWSRDREDPVAISLTGYTIPQSGIGDTTSFRWDPVLEKYIANTKFVLPGKYRAYGISESNDLVHWTRPRMMFYRDGRDPEGMQFYAHHTFHYESMWFGLPKPMLITEPEPGKLWKHCELQLSLSRDGRNFTRCQDRTPILPVSEAPDAWDGDYPCIASGGPFRVGDELWFYYSDRRHGNRPGPKPEDAGVQRIGIATLRIDGFASVNAADKPGTVLTRPLSFKAGRLYVNADVGENGYIKAALQKAWGGEILDSHSLERCNPVTASAIAADVTWVGDDTIECPEKESLRLVFELKNAKLYSFWIE